jgi:hypothetical protein
MSIDTLIDLTIPFTKIAIGLIVLVGANHFFQAIKEILISRFALSTHDNIVQTAFKTVKCAGKLVHPSHNEKVLHNLIKNINEAKGVDDLLLDDIIFRLNEIETRLGVGLQNDRN